MPCQAQPRVQTCTGPYTEEACATCAGLEAEDRCMRLTPAMGKPYMSKDPEAPCVGPFSATGWRCPDCNRQNRLCASVDAWKALVADRERKAKWLSSIPPIARNELKQVYGPGDWGALTPAAIDHNYKALDGLDWCPWIKIGNLYVTVTAGNDDGWRLLVQRHLEPDSTHPRTINVFTGRHGNEEGTIVADDELFSDKVMDPTHYLQDIIQKAVADGCYLSREESLRPRIKLWDVGTTQGSTMTKTLQLASERLKKGEIVIFAWCWSLLSFYKVSIKEAEGFSRYDLAQAYNLRIEHIVSSKYGWAAFSGLGQGTGHTLAQASDADAQPFKASPWRVMVKDHSRATDELLRTQYPGGIPEGTASSTKGTLTGTLKTALNKISPVHYH